jgi:hypothetical protein
MSAASPASFWVVAIAGSIAVHGAIGMGLYAMPMPEPQSQAHTEITIAAPEAATSLSQPLSETVSALATDEAQPAVQSSSTALTATDRSETPDSPKPDALTAIKGNGALAPRKIDAADPEQIVPTQLPTVTEDLDLVAALIERETAGATGAETVLQATESAGIVAARKDETGEAQEATTVEQLIATSESEQAASATVEAAPLAELRAAIEPTPIRAPDSVAPANPFDAPLSEGGTEIAIPAAQGGALQTAQPVAPARPATAASAPVTPTAGVPVVISAARPSSNSNVVTPLSSDGGLAIAPAPTHGFQTTPGAGDTLTPAPSAAFTVGATEAIGAKSPTDAPIVGQSDGEEQAVAMFPLQDLAPDDLDIPDSSGMRVEDFLEESAGSECLLALPLDPMQASVEAYSDSPDAVHELGAEFMRVAGLDLKTEMRRVSRKQCGALSFARSLPAYPNFPLHLTLSRPEIASGEKLSGVVTGLRKDTLYLIVVDDDGKAELVSTSATGSLRAVEFSAPMTLTSNPGSAVQLLVAIASDGPLRNLPQKPGMPASEYFTKLTFEIIGDSRSIAYGITSFVVK